METKKKMTKKTAWKTTPERETQNTVEFFALTIPGIKHISDEVVYEGNLRFGDTAGVPVENGHHHWQPLSLLLICLQGNTHNSINRELRRQEAIYLIKYAK